MEMKNGRLIVVLGMHRGGTSLVARSLLALGVELGNNLIPPRNDNPRGYWEDMDIIQLNIEILHFLNSDWDFLNPIQPKDVDALIRNGYLLRAVEILRKKMAGVPIFGFKDPRVSKLLPFWKEVFAYGQLKVGYILIIRHPLSVCKSLLKRNGLDFEKSYLLWLQHVLISFVGTQGENCVVVDYDRMMQSPEAEMTRIAQKLQLKIDPAELEKFELEFIDHELRHTIHQSNDLMLDEAAPRLVGEVYSRALDLAADNARVDDASFKTSLKEWSQEFSQLRSVLVLADKLASRLVEREKAVQALTAQVEEREHALQVLKAQAAEREHALQVLKAQVEEREHALQALTAQAEEREHALQALTAQAAKREQQMATLAVQYNEITSSLIGRAVMLTRRLRVRLLPPGSRLQRLVKKIGSILLFPLSLPQNRKRNQEISLIRASGLFDPDWYLAHYPDIAQAGEDPLFHYIKYGGFEGRDPGPSFSSAWYLETYEDVRKAGVNPLIHFLKSGRLEKRTPLPTQDKDQLPGTSSPKS